VPIISTSDVNAQAEKSCALIVAREHDPMVSEHKKGSYRATPRWWKDLVLDELGRRGRGSVGQMAKEIGCAQSAVSQLLAKSRPGKPAPETSRIAARVAEWTGVPLPDEIAFEDFAELVSEVQRLEKRNPEAVKHALELVRALRIAEERAQKDG
jgi:predicted transcriptional regulator